MVALVAFVFAFVAMVLAALLIGVLIVLGAEDTTLSAPTTGFVMVAAVKVVGVLAAALVLRLFGLRSALGIGFAGQATLFVGATAGELISMTLGLVTGSVGAVVVTALLIRRQSR